MWRHPLPAPRPTRPGAPDPAPAVPLAVVALAVVALIVALIITPLVAVAWPAVAVAQEPDTVNAEPCRHSPEARQLDFWIGTWDVHNPETGRVVGVNAIEPMLNGCALLESWTGAGGSSGTSLNFYDPQRKTWRQVWVSDRHNVLDYRQGELRDGAMRFSGLTIDAAGDTTLQRLTFFDVAPDTVRQLFESSKDGGESWSADWVGIYVRRPR